MILKKLTLWIFLIYLLSLLISCSKLIKNQNEAPTSPIVNSVTVGDTQITFSWENTSDINFEKTVILQSTILNLEYDQWKTIYEGKGTTFTDTDLLNNTTYYYAFYSVNSTGSQSSYIFHVIYK